MANPSISVVIVNMNGEKYLKDCLGALSGQTFKDFEVIVVDNGSEDSSLHLLKTDFPWVNVIPLDSNTGFARGNNIGFRSSSARYIATLNNDTLPDRGWLAGLFDAAEADAAVGMVASKILLGREGNELDSAGMLVYPDGMTRQRGRGQQDRGQFDKAEEVLFPSACAALYRREMLEETGFFDEEFFSYCEDADLGLRGRIAGWRAVMAPGAVVRHLYSQTGGRYSEFKAYHVERNRLWVLIKDFPLSYVLLFPLYSLWRYAVQVYGLLSRRGSAARFVESGGSGALLYILLKAWVMALVALPGMVNKRRRVWRRRRLSRSEYRRLLNKFRISASELVLTD